MAFTIKFYVSNVDEKVVDKTDFLEDAFSATGTLKEETSVVRPTILIERSTYPECNYAYISQFKRYYFVTEIVSVRNNLWAISMECDVLNTYKTGIKKCVGFVDRCEVGYNPMVIDNLVTVTSEVDIETIALNNMLFDIKDGSVVLSGFNLNVLSS